MVYALINLKLQHSHLPSPLFHTPRWDIFEPCLGGERNMKQQKK